MTEHIWPHEKLAKKFEQLGERGEVIRAKIKAAERALADLAHEYRLFAEDAAQTVRISIMQRDNAEQEVESLRKGEKP